MKRTVFLIFLLLSSCSPETPLQKFNRQLNHLEAMANDTVKRKPYLFGK